MLRPESNGGCVLPSMPHQLIINFIRFPPREPSSDSFGRKRRNSEPAHGSTSEGTGQGVIRGREGH